MKKYNDKTFGFYLNKYITEFLPSIRGLAENSILAYRDTFVLFINYLKECKKLIVENLSMSFISYDIIIEFCKWLEEKHHYSISSRNHRFMIIRGFIKWLSMENPEYIKLSEQIYDVKLKKAPIQNMPYMSIDEMQILLKQPDSSTKIGIRDLAMLILTYDAGARVSEIINLKFRNIRFDAPALLQITGKGNKIRTVPLMNQTLKYLKEYMKRWNIDYNNVQNEYVFNTNQKAPFSRQGFQYVLSKYVSKAKNENPTMFQINITPHTLRHSKAMHLLQAGTNIVYIRDILGHSNLDTTEKYAKADNAMKREALSKAEINMPKIAEPASCLSIFPNTIENDMEVWLKNINK